MKKLILFLTICMIMIWSVDLHATHLVGAELTWTIVGPHQYIVKLSVYRDCNTTVPLVESYRVGWQSVTCNDTGSFLVTADTAAPINETDTCPSQHSTCDGGSVYGVLDFVYTSGVVDLPSGCPDVILSWASGNRNGVITNLTNPLNDALYISAELNTSLIDNSPQFLNPLTVDLCLGQTNYINQGGYDPDGDSLVYVLDTAQGDNGGPNAYPYTPIDLGYTAGYTPSHPITSATFNFTPSTGEVTVIPTNTEVDVVKFVVYEYRNGVLIGHVERDMQVTIQICTDTLPTISGIGSINSTDSIYTIEPCTSKCFTIYTAGSDSAKVLNLSITGQNAFPGATFTISSGNDPSLTFCWSPTRENAGTYTFYVTVKDNACPEPGENTKGYTVIVPQIYPAGPDQTICQYTTTNALGTSTQSGRWTQMSVNPVVTNIVTPTSPTTLITGFTAAGRYNFIWISDTTCIDTMSVFVTAKPNAGTDQIICQNSTATMAGSGSGTWRAESTNPAATTIADSILATTTITGFSVVGTYRFVWTVNGCTDTMSVTVETRPNAGPDQSICGGNGTISMAATSGSGPWTADSLNPATTVITNPSSLTTTITGLTTAGIYAYYWGVGCQDTVLISINTKPNGGPNQSICENSTVTTGATGTGTWSAAPGNPANTTIANPASDSTLISGFTVAGTYSFIWTDGTCADTVKVSVIGRHTGGPDQSICLNNTVTMAATGTGTWTAGTNPATTTITTPISPTTTITGFTVAGTYTYYWASTSCSGSLDTVLIVVNPKPNGGQNQTTCQYSTATMTATGTGTWSALGTNPVTTTIVTPTSPTTEITGFTLAGTYKYIWTVNGCTDTVSVTVIAKPNAGPDQTICQYTTTDMGSTGSGVWTVDPNNPSVIIFANDTSPTTLSSGYTVPGTDTLYWSRNGCSDTILIHVTAKPNAGPDQTTCQYSTATMAASGAGLWSALSSNPATNIIVTPTSPTTEITGFTLPGTYGYVWTSNGCTDTAYITVIAKPNAGPDQTICQYTTTDMDGTGSGVWTLANGNPVVVTFANNTSPTTLVSGFTAPGAYTLIWTVNGCSDSVIVNVTAKPNAGPDQTICQYSTAIMAGIGMGTWSALGNNPATTTIVTPTSATTEITGFTLPGTYGYVWTVNGCTDTTYVTVTAKPNAGSDQTTCLFSPVNMEATGTGTWSALGTNPATTTIVTPTSPTTEITGFTIVGTYSYIWTSNGCPDTANVTVIPQPNAGPDQTTCQFSTVTMAATGTGTWSALNTNPVTTIIDTPTSPTTVITGFTQPGTYGYIWTSNGECTDTTYVTVNPKPNAGPGMNFCIPGSPTLYATGGPGVWTALSTNPGTTVIVSPNNDTTAITGITLEGYYSYIWTVNGCTDTVEIAAYATDPAGPDQTICQYNTITTGSFGTGTWVTLSSNPTTTTIANINGDTTTISGFSLPGVYGYIWSVGLQCSDTFFVTVTPKPDAGPDDTTCQYSTGSLSATGTGTWSALSTNPAVTVIVSPSSSGTAITGLSLPGTYGYVWTVNGCTDTAYVTVTAKPNAGPDQTICQNSTTNMTATGSGRWSAATGNPSTVIFANPNDSTTSVSGFAAPGTDTLYWTQNGCSDTVLINVTPTPNAGTDQTICQYFTAIMDATGTGTWTASAGNPAGVTFANATDSITSVSGFTAPGTYILYWSLNGCSDSVLINVTAKPNAGSDQTICQYSTTAMNAIGSGTWTQAAGNPSVVTIANATSPTTGVSGFTVPGTDTLYWSDNGCSDTVLINVTAKPNAGPSQTICQNSTATTAATGSGTWTAAPGNPAVITFTDPNDSITTVTGFIDSGTYTLYWSQNGCSDTTYVYVSETSTISVSLSTTGICPGQNDTLTANVSVSGGSFLWAPGGATTQGIIVSPATTTTYTVTYTLAVCGTYTDSATVTVYPPLTLTTQNDTICNGSTATLSTTPSTTGGSYLWSPGAFTTSSITVTPNTNTTYTVTYSLAGCPATSVSDTVDVTIPPTLTVNSATVCQGDSATLTALPSLAGGTYTWTPGGATTQSITVAPGSTTTYTVSYAIPGSVCPPTTQTATVTVTPQPTVSVNDASICVGQSATLLATPSITGGTYVWAPGGATTASITETPATTSTYTVTYTIAGCGSATGSGTITVNPNPILDSLIPQPITCYGYTNGTLTPVITPASGTYTYKWSNSETGAVDTGLAAGTYTLTITDQNGCTASDAVTGVIAAAPADGVAEVMPTDITVYQDSMIQLTTSLSNYTPLVYSWTPTAGLSCTNCPDPIVNTATATDTLLTYTVTISYSNGCTVIATDSIHLLFGIAIPDAFTPNGDGKNDTFFIPAKGVNDFHMTIYNRWGELVFESYDPNNGWDGSYKGQQQPSGEYVFFVAITYYNGQSTARTGNITLLR